MNESDKNYRLGLFCVAPIVDVSAGALPRCVGDDTALDVVDVAP
jgi:hypothetical protein